MTFGIASVQSFDAADEHINLEFRYETSKLANKTLTSGLGSMDSGGSMPGTENITTCYRTISISIRII
jgi:hypothetical protein